MGRSEDERLVDAIENGDDRAVVDAFRRGARPDAVSADGWPALFLAIDAGRLEAVRSILDHGADPDSRFTGNSALLTAVFRGNPAVVHLLLDRGADPNAAGEEGDLPLKHAAGEGQVEIARLLLDSGADPHRAAGFDDANALGSAAMAGHRELVLLLIERGANPRSRDRSDRTALQRALDEQQVAPEAGRLDVIELLLKYGPSPSDPPDSAP